MVLLTCGLKIKQISEYLKKERLVDIENKPVVTSGAGKRVIQGLGGGRYKVLDIR